MPGIYLHLAMRTKCWTLNSRAIAPAPRTFSPESTTESTTDSAIDSTTQTQHNQPLNQARNQPLNRAFNSHSIAPAFPHFEPWVNT